MLTHWLECQDNSFESNSKVEYQISHVSIQSHHRALWIITYLPLLNNGLAHNCITVKLSATEWSYHIIIILFVVQTRVVLEVFVFLGGLHELSLYTRVGVRMTSIRNDVKFSLRPSLSTKSRREIIYFLCYNNTIFHTSRKPTNLDLRLHVFLLILLHNTNYKTFGVEFMPSSIIIFILIINFVNPQNDVQSTEWI